VPVKRSAGLLVFRSPEGALEVLLGHMGGPLWAAKNLGAWSIPKGEYGPDETALDAARREYEEELGLAPPEGVLLELGEAQQRSGKIVTVWAVEGDVDPRQVRPGTFTMEWPRGSGVQQTFPEIDRVEWFDPAGAAEKLLAGQRPFLDRLVEQLASRR
jgi:predicted NUDIX family NTP pyrophosphohydrolase